VNKIEIKIVGSIPDENTLNEIQNIAKIFIYEQRMKNFNYPIKEGILIKKKQNIFQKKNGNHQTIFTNYFSNVKVKGLM